MVQKLMIENFPFYSILYLYINPGSQSYNNVTLALVTHSSSIRYAVIDLISI